MMETQHISKTSKLLFSSDMGDNARKFYYYNLQACLVLKTITVQLITYNYFLIHISPCTESSLLCMTLKAKFKKNV